MGAMPRASASGACVEELREFPGLAHRAQWIAEIGGVRYIDDSKGTNVRATLAAVAGLPGPLVLIAGGDGKGQDFTPLRAAYLYAMAQRGAFPVNPNRSCVRMELILMTTPSIS